MCGRYTLHTSPQRIAELFDAQLAVGLADFVPRYNIAPTTPAPVVRMADVGRVIELMRWGLIPHWSREPSTKFATFNARSEDAAEKASYRGPMRYRRCLVPVDGFYEWRKRDRGPKQPYLFRMADDQPFALAGLWDVWQDELQSFSVLTTKANTLMATIHDRMPVIVDPADHARWLDPGLQDPDAVADVLKPFPSELMLATPVTTYVSNARNEGPRCIEPVEPTIFD
ncbi:SOS response-associated peptidase [Phycisphaerales bacterium AB-hyl4]|uniref:Abasic site processing protein n=1 Tax=Natronomicrosphaera hydrolytica TaxID=3242702 RepID=A0ABV4U607_9BACT